MRRREFIALLGGAAATWPLSLRAQQPAKIPRIGIIDDAPMWHAFRQALRELGYVEGQNVAYEYRYGEGAPDRLAQAAAELVRRPVDVIATFGTPPTSAAKEATTSIPIVIDEHSHRHGRCWRSGARGPGREFRPPRRKHHREYRAQSRPRSQADADAARGNRQREPRRFPHQSR
ncbi:MAG: hypothetical protein E6G76_13520 [Alphaproteobacteria bacterium]|nr:MAG: hypothetical protein E6G76_13520 [Alphaproteobacteria bacterium]